eukprot:g11854.t1
MGVLTSGDGNYEGGAEAPDPVQLFRRRVAAIATDLEAVQRDVSGIDPFVASAKSAIRGLQLPRTVDDDVFAQLQLLAGGTTSGGSSLFPAGPGRCGPRAAGMGRGTTLDTASALAVEDSAIRIQRCFRAHVAWKRKKRRLLRSKGFRCVEKWLVRIWCRHAWAQLWRERVLCPLFHREFALSRLVVARYRRRLVGRAVAAAWRPWVLLRRRMRVRLGSALDLPGRSSVERAKNYQAKTRLFALRRDFCWQMVNEEGKHSVANRGREGLLQAKAWRGWLGGALELESTEL